MVWNAISLQNMIHTSSSHSKYLFFFSGINGRVLAILEGFSTKQTEAILEIYLNLFLKQRQIQLNIDFISAVFLNSSLETLPFND